MTFSHTVTTAEEALQNFPLKCAGIKTKKYQHPQNCTFILSTLSYMYIYVYIFIHLSQHFSCIHQTHKVFLLALVKP